MGTPRVSSTGTRFQHFQQTSAPRLSACTFYTPRAGIVQGGSTGCLGHAVRLGTRWRRPTQAHAGALGRGGVGISPEWPLLGRGSAEGMETGQRSYLYALPIFPPELSVAAALREELRFREQQSPAVQNSNSGLF